ncbi:hypothetical protein AYI70_g778 [Smittium culicis]|uniref:Uncharacterized protein n=1 Tax=Smittium culicis TaxID=133412 RepID=A0A1R1YFC1_9FUNG|nr:hypothetical protein AYI70_g8592 [Smittium culicis]OMJ25610.1 hypothetical protein AYI70_g778 [Smittium culicis]
MLSLPFSLSFFSFFSPSSTLSSFPFLLLFTSSIMLFSSLCFAFSNKYASITDCQYALYVWNPCADSGFSGPPVLPSSFVIS